MAVLGPESLTLEVPNLAEGIKFYTDAGLVVSSDGNIARFRCAGQVRDCLTLIGGAAGKRLHHVTLRADGLDDMAAKVAAHGGKVVAAPAGHDPDGHDPDELWVTDPHGMLIHLVDSPPNTAPAEGAKFEINAPGRIVRTRRPAILPGQSYKSAEPLKLGHILLFSPDVPASVEFVTEALGMGLADKAQDIIAFCCARQNSDHHVLAFAKSPGIGFHHASFQVNDPDEVGRYGRALIEKTGKGDWGFGRHTIGSNFFHYIQDPWGSWFEYYSDIDFIDDYALWTPSNYGLEDSLANWGPPVPSDFVHNHEVE